ncbi:MAG: class I SAM-dependent methyltransferase [Acetobacteraceae bacterium]
MTTETIDRPTLDMHAAEGFAGRMADMLNHGAAAVMISAGHRLGLFDLMAGQPAQTGQEIAQRGRLNERYLREWLAAMVTAGIMTYDPAARRYGLPEEHAACLTRGAALGNLAVYAQHVALLGKLEDTTLRLIETGGGTDYGAYPCFHQLMAEDSEQTVTAGLFDHVLPLVPGIEQRLAAGIDVLDAGCGRGAALIAMARRYPQSRFVGYDLCGDAIEFAARAAEDAGLANLRFERRDMTGYVEPDRWDFVTSFDAVHDQKDPAALVRGLRASLRPGGVYLMQDIGGSAFLEKNADFPMATFLYAISLVHCTPVSIGQGGAGLGTMWGWETALRFLWEAGFSSVEKHLLPHDPMNVWFVSHV